MTFDANEVYDKKIYVNGIFDNQVDAWNGLAIDDTVTRFGFIGDGSEASTYNAGRNNQYFEGMLDDVRYFDYALSDNEIERLANYYPLDLNLYQAVKSMAIGEMAVKKGGTIIAVNECIEGIGIGQDKFKELIFSGMTPQEIHKKILTKEIVVPDQYISIPCISTDLLKFFF